MFFSCIKWIEIKFNEKLMLIDSNAMYLSPSKTPGWVNEKKNGDKNAARSENYIFIHPQVPNRIIHFIKNASPTSNTTILFTSL